MANSNQSGRDQQGSRDQQGGSNRGLASMDDDKRREIAAEGGRAAHEQGTAHEFTSEEAREAGRKGGQPSVDSRGSSERSSDRDQQTGGRGGGTKGVSGTDRDPGSSTTRGGSGSRNQ